ncbi:MAG: helical backbone metal receptor [bacterium]
MKKINVALQDLTPFIPFILLLLVISCGRRETPKKLRIVSLSPAVTEIIYALKGEKYLAGVTNFCNWPKEVSKKERVGDFSFPSIEKIILLKPTKIFAAGPGQGKVLRSLGNLGYEIRIYHPETVDELFKQISEIGTVIGEKKNAEKLLLKMKDEIKQIPKVKNKTVFIEVCSKPLIAASKTTFLSSVCRTLGLRNVCALPHSYPQINIEWLIKKKPDFILLTGTSVEEFLSIYPFFSGGKIIPTMNPDILVRPGPRIVEGMWEIRWRISKLLGENHTEKKLSSPHLRGQKATDAKK